MKGTEDLMAFIRFLDNREEYDARLKELDQATQKSKAAEAQAIAEQSEADKRVDALNAQIDDFEPHKKLLNDMQNKLDAKEERIIGKEEKLKADKKEHVEQVNKLEAKQAELEKFEKNLGLLEARLAEIKADLDLRAEVVKEKEAKIKDFFKD